jgi:hypothetical protein
MKKINVLCKANRTFQGDMEVKATAFIDYTKGTYQGDLGKHYGAGRCYPSKKYPVPYAKLQKVAAKRGKFDAFREKGELQILCDCSFFKGVSKETGELIHWVRINLGTKEKPYERNFYINEDILETMEDLHIKVDFIEASEGADAQEELDFTTEDNE